MAKNIIHLETKLKESKINKVNIEGEQEEPSSNTIKQNNKIIEESKNLEAHNDIIGKEVPVEKLQNSSGGDQSDGQHLEKNKDETPEIICQCKECAYTCKKEVTMKKHVNTKHTKQKCKVCDLEFETSIPVLKHVTEKHKGSIDESIQEREKKKMLNQKSFKLKMASLNVAIVIVPNEDTLNIHKDEGMKMCQFCTMVTQHG